MTSLKTFKNYFLPIVFVSFTYATVAQVLKPGFDKQECIQSFNAVDLVHTDLEKWVEKSEEVFPLGFKFEYRSETVAFDNLWDLWLDTSRNVAMISIRGSIATEASFLANLFAAMVPATGSVRIDENYEFNYKLADNPRAAVQVGWFLAMAHMSRTIEAKIDSCYHLGYKDFIISGHSQGGGIAYMLTSYLRHKQLDKNLEQDIQFKTYCSAAPKPGNLFFSYDYEHITDGGWGFNVVNAADWVPDVPFTVQTVDDFTNVNPFRHAEAMIGKQKFPKNVVLRHMYRQLDRPTKKAQKRFQKYLGKMVSSIVKKQIPETEIPAFYKSNYYVRTGDYIVLLPDEEYYQKFSNAEDNPQVWMHHFLDPYRYLIEKY